MKDEDVVVKADVEFSDNYTIPWVHLRLPFSKSSRMKNKMVRSTKKAIKNSLSKKNRDECFAYVYGVSNLITGEKQLYFISKLVDAINLNTDEEIKMSQVRKIFRLENDITTRAVLESSFVNSDTVRNILIRQLLNSVHDDTMNDKKLVVLISNLSKSEIELIKKMFSYCFQLKFLYHGLSTYDSKPKTLIRKENIWITINDFGDTNLRKLGINTISYEDFRKLCDLGLIRETSQQRHLNNLTLCKTLQFIENEAIKALTVENFTIEFTNFEQNFAYEYKVSDKTLNVSYHQLTSKGQALFKLFNEEKLIEFKLSDFNYEQFKSHMLK